MSDFQLTFPYEKCRNCGNDKIGTVYRAYLKLVKSGNPPPDMGIFLDNQTGFQKVCCRMHVLCPNHLPAGLAVLDEAKRKQVWAEDPYDLDDPFYQATNMELRNSGIDTGEDLHEGKTLMVPESITVPEIIDLALDEIEHIDVPEIESPKLKSGERSESQKGKIKLALPKVAGRKKKEST